MRSARDLESYKRIFGEDLGRDDELILDVGSGDSTMADELMELSGHKAKVVKLDFDYATNPPEGLAPAVAADATHLPFADESFDRVVSLWMMPYLGETKGRQAIAEMIRVLKDDGQAALFPSKPFKKSQGENLKIEYDPAGKSFASLNCLVITKPSDFDDWSDTDKNEFYTDAARFVTTKDITTRFLKAGLMKVIQHKGEYQTKEFGSQNTLHSKRKQDL